MGVQCDEKVIAVVHSRFADRTCSVFSSSTLELLYSLNFSLSHFRIGDDFIFLTSLSADDRLTLIDKLTGAIDHQERYDFLSYDFFSNKHGYQFTMVGNVVVISKLCGDLLLLSKDSETSKWIKKEQETGIKVCNISGEDNFLVLWSQDSIQLWDWKKGMLAGKRVQCEHIANVKFSNPYAFTQHGNETLQIYNMFTGELIREIIFSAAWLIHLNSMFFTVVATNKKVSVFDVKELTNKNIETNELWQKDFETTYGEATKSKMVLVVRNSVTIYDFWPDKDYEVTEEPK